MQDWRELKVIMPTPAAAASTSDSDDCNSSPLSGSMLRLAGYLLRTQDGSALGSGGLGNVYRGHHLASGAEVAVKLGRDFVASEGSDGEQGRHGERPGAGCVAPAYPALACPLSILLQIFPGGAS